jgi:hypothetical protein
VSRALGRQPSCEERAADVLARCLAGQPIDDATLRGLIHDECGSALFSTVAEGLSDRFEARLVGCYVEVFSRVVAMVRRGVSAAALMARYREVTTARKLSSVPIGAFVLSRVTVGADVAITSVVLDALAKRLPSADIVLVGDSRLGELFGANPRVRTQEFVYPRRASVRHGIDASYRLGDVVARPGWIVVDPDSRLTQLGLVPVCDASSYYLFPSRTWGADGERPLGALVREWVATCFGTTDAASYVAPTCAAPDVHAPAVAVSFGVGGNVRKRVSCGFEAAVVRELVERGAHVHLDAGGSPAEREQTAQIAGRLNSASVSVHVGTVAEFAALIRSSNLYVGYDSAGQHIAAALGVPFVSIFRGYACPRMAVRWRPYGRGAGHVVDAETASDESVLNNVLAAVDTLGVLCSFDRSRVTISHERRSRTT